MRGQVRIRSSRTGRLAQAVVLGWCLAIFCSSAPVPISIARSVPSSQATASIMRSGPAKTHPRPRQNRSAEQQKNTAYESLNDAERLRSEWKESSFKAAIRKYSSATALFRARGDRTGEAKALLGLGQVLTILGEHSDALNQLNRASRLARASSEAKLQIDILNSLAEVQIDSLSAPTYAENALDLAEKSNYSSGSARALKSLGVMSFFNGNSDKAVEHLQRSILLWKNEGDPAGHAEALIRLGLTYGDSGNLMKADQCFAEASALAKIAHDPQKEARVALGIGLIHTALGEWQKALDRSQPALVELRQIGDKENLVFALNGLGFQYNLLGKLEESLASFRESAELSRRMGNRGGQAFTLAHIASINFAAGRRREALGIYQKVIRIARSQRDGRTESYALNDTGRIYESMGNGNMALHSFQQGLAIARRLNQPRLLTYSLDNLGTLYLRQHNHKKADAFYREAFSIIEQAGDQAEQTRILYNIARLDRERGNIDGALRNVQNIIQRAESQRTSVISPDVRAAYFATVYQYHELLIALLMQKHLREPDAGHDLAAFEASEVGRARSLIEMLIEGRVDMREGVPSELLEEERSLTRRLSKKAEEERHLLGMRFSLPKTRLKKGENRAELVTKNDQELEAVQREINQLNTQLDQVSADIANRSSKYSALLHPRSVGLSELRKRLLDDQTLAIEYSLGEQHSYLWVIGPGFFRSHQLPPRAEIEQWATRFYGALVSPELDKVDSPTLGRSRANLKEYRAARDWLSNTLLGPIADIIGSKRLVIVADGALQYIPLAALTEPGVDEPLVVRHEIVSVASLSVLLELQDQLLNRSPAPKTLVVIADPVFEQDDDRLKRPNETRSTTRAVDRILQTSVLKAARSPLGNLPVEGQATNLIRLLFSAEEAETLGELLPEAERRIETGFGASRKTVTGDLLSQYRIIHFATHGFLNFRRPMLSCLMLSCFDEGGQPQDGALRLQDIYRMRLSADLVVLSACQTALGKEVRGEGLVGLTRGFMYAGAPRVLASLWNVDDRGSAELMKRFYQHLLGSEKLRPAAALRKAQFEMISHQRWRDPYYWAAFSLHGEWK